MTAEWKIRWAWRDPGTGKLLPERYSTKDEALEYMPRANGWELVRIKTMKPARYHHKEKQKAAPPK